MGKEHELGPQNVGAAVPFNTQVFPESYTYDYIIVGGGTAGCVLASRLSEDPTVSVLLIEQGPVADTWASRVPAMSANLYSTDSVAAQWWSLPLSHVNNRSLGLIRGEALGGTSRINSMLYTRGPPGDYNQWQALGNDGWSYEDLQPYFIKSENARTHREAKHRGKNGVWQNRQFGTPQYRSVFLVQRALEDIGICTYPDLNSPEMPSAAQGTLDVTQDDSYHRHSTNRAFLPPQLIRERHDRLKICAETLVTRVALCTEGDEVRAVGVHFEATNPRKAWKRYFAKVRREVVLCSGALGSPQILMCSGIGPKEHLSEKGVPVIRDVPAVGAYLQDHIGVPLTYEVPLSESLHQLEANPLKALQEFIKYLLTGRGMLSHPFQEASAFVPTWLLKDDCSLPIVDLRELDATVPENRADLELMHLGNNCTDADIPGKGLSTLLPTLIRPKSQGSVRLATSNPRARPDVDLGYFTDTEDYVPLRKGVRLALRVAADVRKQGYPLQDLIVPTGTSDEEIDQFIRTNLRTCFHYTSTCRMGAAVDGERPSVVDTRLRVHGLKGLRVADASVFPEIVCAHTMAPVVMVAEKCAVMMKEEAQYIS
ncbi:alcohol oxidase [Dichomitus squalens]|uniref:Alcohol oxidase n=1 Tax=Dichomitus squalens TaxID=114155 RepID=A0A4Q9PNX7_9APHY|nr:alcohol oxidase [Dichomitus squalens]TBU56003.1 alcohol oxidase [Dichomitus squalens]